MLSRPRITKRLNGLPSALSLGLAEHVHGNSLADVRAGSDAVDRLLHLSVTAVAAFDGVGGRWQQGIIQEGQRFFQGGREQLVQRPAETLERPSVSISRSDKCQHS
jgi:hypothetical protein